MIMIDPSDKLVPSYWTWRAEAPLPQGLYIFERENVLNLLRRQDDRKNATGEAMRV